MALSSLLTFNTCHLSHITFKVCFLTLRVSLSTEQCCRSAQHLISGALNAGIYWSFLYPIFLFKVMISQRLFHGSWVLCGRRGIMTCGTLGPYLSFASLEISNTTIYWMFWGVLELNNPNKTNNKDFSLGQPAIS